MPKAWFQAARFVVSLGLIGLIGWWSQGRWAQIIALLATVRVGWLLAGVAVYLTVTGVLSARLQQVLIAVAVRAPFATVLRFALVGMFFNNFLPTATGGDLVKAYYLGRSTNTAWMAWFGVAVDRVLGWMTFVVLTAIALSIRPQDPLLSHIGWGYVTTGAVVVLAAAIGAAWARHQTAHGGGQRWQRLRPILKLLTLRSATIKPLGTAFLWSLVAQASFVASLWLLTRSLSLVVGFGDLLLIVPFVATASMLPSVNGLGVRESALVLCLERSVGRESALAVAILLFVVLLVTSLIGGALYAAQGGRYDRQRVAGDFGLPGVQDAGAARG